jgi:hypothetical protein
VVVQAPTKEQPVWLSRSTVEPLDENPHDFSSQSAASTVPESAAEVVKKVMKENIGTKRQLDDDIMANLVAYEKPAKKSKMSTPGASFAGQQQSSSDDEASTSEEEIDKQPADGGKRRPAPGEVAAAAALTVLQPQAPVIEEGTIDDEEEEEITLKVGDRTVALSDVTDEMIEEMTAEERETYERLAREAAEDFF